MPARRAAIAAAAADLPTTGTPGGLSCGLPAPPPPGCAHGVASGGGVFSFGEPLRAANAEPADADAPPSPLPRSAAPPSRSESAARAAARGGHRSSALPAAAASAAPASDARPGDLPRLRGPVGEHARDARLA